MSKKIRSRIATVIGTLTSLLTALVVIDFDTFNFHRLNDLRDLAIVLLPFFGGLVSSINKKED